MIDVHSWKYVLKFHPRMVMTDHVALKYSYQTYIKHIGRIENLLVRVGKSQ